MNASIASKLAALALVACVPSTLLAQGVISESFTGLNLTVPDYNSSGVSDTRTIASSLTSILDVNVTLTIAGKDFGAFNGDFYAYLTHGTSIAVLLNRPGRSSGNLLGYEDNGFSSVKFDDSAGHDIHNYQLTLSASPVTGTWQPDGRTATPDQTLDTSPRSALLSQFNGSDPNGAWTLFVADLGEGGLGELTSWSLQISAVPEMSQTTLVSAGLLMGLVVVREVRRRRQTAGPQAAEPVIQ